MRYRSLFLVGCLALLGSSLPVHAQAKKAVEVPYPPVLPNGKEVVTDTSDEFLKSPIKLKDGVTVAKTAPTVDFLYYPGQTYPGNPWSNWGDSVAANGKYYASIGDHWSVDSKNVNKRAGSAYVYEYDPEKKAFRLLADVQKLLNLPEATYVPGKIHSRLDLGDDGCLYFSTHRGSTAVTTDKFNYKGDWVIKTDVKTGKAEIVVQGPVPNHCIPTSVLDPKRLIFYGGTAAGVGKDINFFAYDCKNGKLLYSGPDGPNRYLMLAKSTGKAYYVPNTQEGQLVRFDPEKPDAPTKIDATIGLRSATQETADGHIYSVSTGQGTGEADIWSFNTKTEKSEKIGTVTVGREAYVASIDVDPTGRYLYYIAGAHGGSERDGSPIVQFDVKTKQKKVIAFLHPYYQEHYGCTLKGTYSSAIDPAGDKLYVTWNASRGSKVWDCCALTVIHIPASERQP